MKEELRASLKILQEGNTILYPTDTVWGVGCDATNEAAVSRIYKIKQREESKSLIILVSDITMLKRYVSEIPTSVLDLLEKPLKPTSIIYQNPKNLAENVIAMDQTVAIRIVQNDFCKNLINSFGKPIVSTSANISGKPTPMNFKEIDKAILQSIDYIVNLHQNEEGVKSSRILRVMEDGTVQELRP